MKRFALIQLSSLVDRQMRTPLAEVCQFAISPTIVGSPRDQRKAKSAYRSQSTQTSVSVPTVPYYGNYYQCTLRDSYREASVITSTSSTQICALLFLLAIARRTSTVYRNDSGASLSFIMRQMPPHLLFFLAI